MALNPDETLYHYDDFDNTVLRRRWYDVNETLHSAMNLLQDCPPELQQQLIPSIARMIEQTLVESI